ncbi:MAG: tetratricopeptide repeat protein [Acidobacteria bacterium]|nr:tetratricopeptide repeat protein [Acidobacteriota bacterium]
MKSQNFLFLNLCLVFITLINSACVEQKPSLASSPPNVVAENLSGVSSGDAEIDAAQKVIEKTPDAANGYNKLAIVYIRRARETGDFSLNSKAQTAVSRALEIEPDNYNAQKLQASLLLTFHRFQEALEAGTNLQKTHPQDAFIYGVLTDSNVELGNYEEAVEAVQKMVDLRPNMESYARVSQVRSLYGDSDGAIEAMRMAARIADPRDTEAQAWCLVHLGNEYFKVGSYEQAEKVYDEALQVFPNYHFALTGKGGARAAVGDYENAVKYYRQSQERVPLTQTIIALGDVYQQMGKAEEAQREYDLAEFIEQKFGNIDRRTLALLWADHNRKLDEALQIATAEHEKRKDIYTADIYAWTLYKKGLLEEAKRAISEAMRLKTKEARIFYHAGMIEKGLGNKRAAADYLQKALRISPSFDILQAEVAKSALQELK